MDALHIVARDQSISLDERFAPDRGLKDEVAVIRGCTQVDSVESEFRDCSSVVHDEEMPVGIKVMLLVWPISPRYTTQ